MAPGSTSLTVAAATSILASGWAAGMGTGLSAFGIPTILNGGTPSEVMVRQWRFQFVRGRAFMPALGALNAINYWNVAYRCWLRGLEWRGFAAAGVSTFFMIPFTLAFIAGINNKLFEASKRREKTLSDDSVRSLIKKWGDLNIVRAVVPILGTGLALWNLCL
ncbi:hypothetical protein ANO14919_106020 [Xylariales sp. No.14919]|nr:hypothetical protein ANO14919_106020 [Xylariales sp. No.14919]